MSILLGYELAMSQLIIASKSYFMVASSTTISTISHKQDLTRFSHGHLPFDYLGCPIFLGRTRFLLRKTFGVLLINMRMKLT